MGAGLEWACERTLEGHVKTVFALASLGDKLISGSLDGTIRVWDLSTGRLDATLTGHKMSVYALVVEGGRLYSASLDGTIRVWDVGTWAEARSVAAYDVAKARRYSRCLLTSGSKLISGSYLSYSSEDNTELLRITRSVYGGDTECEVRVWDLDTLACEHTVRLAAGPDVRCLAGAGGAVWGGVGESVAVWGRD